MAPNNISISLFVELFHAFRHRRINDCVFYCTPWNSAIRSFSCSLAARMRICALYARTTSKHNQNGKLFETCAKSFGNKNNFTDL